MCGRKNWWGFGFGHGHHDHEPGHEHGHGGRHHGREAELTDRGRMAIILDLLKDQPRSGLEITEKLEDKLGGLFQTGPGGVYPLLQMMGDLGYVQEETQDGRKVYVVTASGRTHLAERAEDLTGFWERVDAGKGRLAIRELFHDFKELAFSFREGLQGGRLDPSRIEKIRAIMDRARQEIAQELAS